jgi:hypothetical protein
MKAKVKMAALVLLVATTAMFAVSCGGNAGKKQSADGSTEAAKTETAAPAKGDDKWVSNEYSRQVPRPDVAVKSESWSGQNSEVYMMTLDNPTREQVKAYATKVKEQGFTVNPSESDGKSYFYEARNAAGWNVLIMFSESRSNISITKPE